MSWEAGSTGVLVAVLIAGFAWYERSRPPSQVVALVAALAALAVAGRLAFAAIPNVVATTDIVLFTGYAIGAAPGFAVGALAGLISNFWLGQGPWTPWQMAGWGACGIAGGLLASVTGRRLGRLSLAAACGMAGLAFGALLNLSLMVTYGGEVSLDRFLALSARAIPFDLAHALGNATLALLAGPAIVRMLIRFRERFDWRWQRPVAGQIAIGLIAFALGAGAVPVDSARAGPGPDAAATWLIGAQNADGGFAQTPGEPSSVEMTGWAMLGLEAAGRSPADVRAAGRSPVAYLRREAGAIAGIGDLERTILALAGAGVDVRRFAGRDLVAELRRRRAANGSFAGQVNLTAFGVLALRATGSSGGLGRTLSWLRSVQNSDGGWGFAPGVASDPDSTGAALQAVRGSRSARRGVSYLRREQRRGGGWALAGGGVVNAQSTAWAIQGLIAAGLHPGSLREGGRSGLDYLAARQEADGHYRYSSAIDQSPVWVTAQALLAVNLKSLPLAPVPRAQPSHATANAGTTSAATPAEATPSPAKGRGAPLRATSARASDSAGGFAGRNDERVAREKGGPRPSTAGGRRAPTGKARTTMAASEDDSGGASPLVAIAIGLGSASLALGGTAWLVRRRAW